MVKSPFFVVEDAISPAKCEIIVDKLTSKVPSIGEDGKPLKYEHTLADAELSAYVQQAVQPYVERLEETYNGTIKGFTHMLFQEYFENANRPCEPHGCDNAKFLRKKWVKTKDTDLVGYIWLKDYNSGVPLDPRFEVYGGKLEFPAYDFSLVPQRGTMVIFPGGPHFITAISPVVVGNLQQIKFSIKLHVGEEFWLYQPANFPGTWQEWFSEN